LEALTGKPKLPVEIVFLKDDADAFTLSLEIRTALKGAGWEVQEPAPIPPTSFPQLSGLPAAMGVGGQPSGVTIVANSMSQAEFDDLSNRSLKPEAAKTAFTALEAAIVAGLDGANSAAGGVAAPALGRLRLVVGPKQHF
jgi:hypothetical protein